MRNPFSDPNKLTLVITSPQTSHNIMIITYSFKLNTLIAVADTVIYLIDKGTLFSKADVPVKKLLKLETKIV